jgi:cytoskeletal protein CcmA (bactofilin family)
MPILDPLFYERHHAVYDNGDIHTDIDVTDVNVYGMRNMHILLAKTYSIDDIFRLEAEVMYPDIACDGKVKINGSVGPFRLNNAGTKRNVCK